MIGGGSRARLVVLALVVCGGYAAAQWIHCVIQERAAVKATNEMAAVRREAVRLRPALEPRGLEAVINQAAQDARLRRLTSVAPTGKDQQSDVSIEWESDLRSSLSYLALLKARGPAHEILRLSLTGLEDQPGTLRGRATLAPGPASSVSTFTTVQRDVFYPIWKNEVRFARLASENIRRQEEERRRRQEEDEKKRQEQEAAQQLEARRRAFQTRYVLTGIVTDGKGPIAFLNDDRQQSVMARTGDRLADATVASIDVASGEVKLDGSESMSVVLHLGLAGNRP